MKKFLSLVLALVMTMSLVTISAGAKDYTDASEITYKEAVQVMSELKVIDGYADGSFNPDATLTRGAAAKIICNLILGPTTAAALKADSAVFPDVPADHTFAGYIAYCAQQGIINGYADGTFKPANGLTGYAFMKMLLGALGYDAVAEGYVGANYSIQVAKQALAIGLDDGNEAFDGTKIVNREEALLYAFNAMTADMVAYNQKTEVNTGNAVVTISGGRYVQGNDVEDDYRYAANKKAADDEMQFCEKYFEKLTLAADTNAFGQPVNVWKNGKKEIGTFVKAADAHYEKNVASKEIYADVDLDEVYEFATIIDGVDAGEFAIVKKDKTKLSTKGLVGNGSDVYVYVDEETIVVINTYIYEVADDYNEKKETLTIDQVEKVLYPVDAEASYTLSSEDWDGLDEYAEGDFVLVTIAEDEIKSIAKVEAVKATVTEYVHGESVTADGEEYAYSAASEHNEDEGDLFSYELKKEASFYMDEEGYVLYEKSEEAAKKYLYIAEFSKHSTSTRAAVDAYAYFLDGTEAEIKVSKLNGDSVKASDVENNELLENCCGWFTYTEKDGKYELKTVAQTGCETGDAGVVVDYSKFHTVINDLKDNKFDGTKKTNFLLIDEDGDLRAYTGIKNIPDITGTEDTVVNVVNPDANYAEYVFIDLSKGGEITDDSAKVKDFIFLLKSEARGNDTDDDGYYRYNALVNGEEKKIRYDEDIAGAGDAALTLWTDIEYTSKTYIEGATEVNKIPAEDREKFTKDEITGAVKLSSTTIEIETAGEFTDYFMADDYTIFVIERDGSYDTYTMKQLTRADDLEGDTIYGLLNEDGEYYALYIVRD